MELTREQAIEEHRKMWNWIADKIESLKIVIDIISYKREYLYLFKKGEIANSCFMCEYTNVYCECCPLDWKSNVLSSKCVNRRMVGDDMGLYSRCVNAVTWQEQDKLARQIANLPERNIQ